MRKLRIIYEDKWLVVIEKPSGLLSVGHPTANEENAWHLVGEYLKSKNYRDNAYVCHRLDKFTSGILMFSKSEEIQHQLRDNWNDYVLDRRYVALPSEASGSRPGLPSASGARPYRPYSETDVRRYARF